MTNFIQLTNNLNQNYVFYLQLKDSIKPLSKITFTADECYLYPGRRHMDKRQLFKLVHHIHHRNIPLWMIDKQEKIPVYGIQVIIAHKKAILM